MIASSSRMCERISSGISPRGHGSGGESSVGGGCGSIWSWEKSETSCARVAGRAGAGLGCWVVDVWPCREWWAGLGTVVEALDGLGLGKCFFL